MGLIWASFVNNITTQAKEVFNYGLIWASFAKCVMQHKQMQCLVWGLLCHITWHATNYKCAKTLTILQCTKNHLRQLNLATNSYNII